MRIEVRYQGFVGDARGQRVFNTLRSQIPSLRAVSVVDVYLLSDFPDQSPERTAGLTALFFDTVAQECLVDRSFLQNSDQWSAALEVFYRPGVTDPVGVTARTAIEFALIDFPVDFAVQAGMLFVFDCDGAFADPEWAIVELLLHNPLVQVAERIAPSDAVVGASGRPLRSAPSTRLGGQRPPVRTIPVVGLSLSELCRLSDQRLLALSETEMVAIQRHFTDDDVRCRRQTLGLASEPTDVELEMLAQSWSEHCKHKIFQAVITYRDESGWRTIDGLFRTYIKATTDRVAQARQARGLDDLVSVFDDNSGIVAFDDETLVCFKVETHNSPSALDPYGGAITGIVGVNRDILGTGLGAKPIFNTNVLCFADPQTPVDAVPPGLFHPARVLAGVHNGIVDGGNQSGIPTVAGGILFDQSYIGKPLVFCGTGGVLPRRVSQGPAWQKYAAVGDLAVMVGGRIGKDGIHGATFSSLALDETSPTSAVQIGDPITQRLMTDFLLEARDQGLYSSITDNGAGGLSSSFGEMAESTGGILIDLDQCPLKYPGLAAWEIWVSESQERMSLAVHPDTIDRFLALARQRSVEATVIGRFTDSGAVELLQAGIYVAYLPLEFLYRGLPRMQLRADTAVLPATLPQPVPAALERSPTDQSLQLFRAVLAEKNVASKESLIRQYDHEVQGKTVVRPFSGPAQHGPSDGAVLQVHYAGRRGLTVTHGICPWIGDFDCYAMAANAVDEAYRSHVALGGDPDRAYVLDNFCWPDPVESARTPDGAGKLAQLVRACEGLHDTCLAYELPLISGKDSMKNDVFVAGGKISVRPTLLISLMGITEDVARHPGSAFRQPGDRVIVIGEHVGALAGSAYSRVARGPLASAVAKVPVVDTAAAMVRYRSVARLLAGGVFASIHDVSDGGLWACVVESCIGGGVGARLETPPGYARDDYWFSEAPSRFVVSVHPAMLPTFLRLWDGGEFREIGGVVADPTVEVAESYTAMGPPLVWTLAELEDAWSAAIPQRGGQ